MSKHPEVLWAQRSSDTMQEKNVIYLTINLPDIDESSVNYVLTSTSLSFKATAGTKAEQYAFDFDFYAEVDPEKSTKRLTSRSFTVVLRKKELESEYWPRLTKEKLKTPYIKTDFSRWVDEDEQNGAASLDGDEFGGVGGIPGMDSGDFDFSKFSGDFGGDPSAAANEADSDSDEDGPPALEDPKPAE